MTSTIIIRTEHGDKRIEKAFGKIELERYYIPAMIIWETIRKNEEALMASESQVEEKQG